MGLKILEEDIVALVKDNISLWLHLPDVPFQIDNTEHVV